MKNVANAPTMPATTASMAMMPMFVAIAIGASLLPKHTGHASAARGLADYALASFATLAAASLATLRAGRASFADPAAHAEET